ncbi:MAG: hypothetical protein H6735_27225 [Alphaproteobacteria bacterium]|nr:hypothetical protein [Alphaproteobacteria bacterium]
MASPLIKAIVKGIEPVPGVFSGRGSVAFEVIREGEFAGIRMGVGDVLVCRGDARQGDHTVLVAQGLGRPRLGSRRGGRWLGDAGEPCAEERWRSAGKLVARCRRTRQGWIADLLDPVWAGEQAPAVSQAPVPMEAPQPTAAQLSLFAA